MEGVQGEEGEQITHQYKFAGGNSVMARDRILINGVPVLTLWTAVVAERLGFDRKEALSLGKAVAGMTAQQGTQARDILSSFLHQGRMPLRGRPARRMRD